jgi:hypothetical protein
MTSTKLEAKKSPTLKEAQDYVGGFVTLITLDDGSQLLCNEEGDSLLLEYNPAASALANQRIVGDVIILSGMAVWK